ncbi:hypothetical protein DSO57_1039266, partial [Entomophthora muscae]
MLAHRPSVSVSGYLEPSELFPSLEARVTCQGSKTFSTSNRQSSLLAISFFTLLQPQFPDSQDEEKSLVAHVYVPLLSPPSPLPPEDPGAPGCVPPPNTALTLETADSKVPTPASPSLGSTDPDASPLLCYPDSQEIVEDQLHSILTINAIIRGRRIRKEALITPEILETVALPYAEQLTLPTTEVTNESNSTKKMAQILKYFNVSASLDALMGSSPTLCTALEEFL